MTRLTLNADKLKRDALRDKRAKLLDAWDIAKGNILIGVDVVTDEQMQALIAWYKRVLDLDEQAIEKPPQEIQRYVKEKKV